MSHLESDTYNLPSTPIHNDLFDKWMPVLDSCTLKVMMTFAYCQRKDFIGYHYITRRTKLSKNSVYSSIEILLSHKIIETCESHNIYEIECLLNRKRQTAHYQISEITGSSCSWCGYSTPILHEHHYPIPKREGGKQIVEICANCHSEFHYLAESKFFKISREYYDL
jgi:hypothetical protein